MQRGMAREGRFEEDACLEQVPHAGLVLDQVRHQAAERVHAGS
jgi:hypothetical protein